ncbi:MAG: hypothetical protein KGN02_10185 [bacterium]|nr:hypothetical protein [bacterium]
MTTRLRAAIRRIAEANGGLTARALYEAVAADARVEAALASNACTSDQIFAAIARAEDDDADGARYRADVVAATPRLDRALGALAPVARNAALVAGATPLAAALLRDALNERFEREFRERMESGTLPESMSAMREAPLVDDAEFAARLLRRLARTDAANAPRFEAAAAALARD